MLKLLTRSSLNQLNGAVRNVSTKEPGLSYKEIRVPVPWGHLAGKWWGRQDQRPIVLHHGWQDNCGTFDTLIPLLPKKYSYLALDFPGHGLSSWLPPGMFYHGIDGVTTIRRLMQYFNWPKISLMGHSLGAITNFTYTIMYPETVDFLICLEGLKPLVFEDKKIDRMVTTMEKFIKYDNLNNLKNEPPSYSFEELEKRLHEGTRKSVALDSCKYIIKRNTAPSSMEPNKFYFSRDARLKVSVLLGWAQKDIVENVHRITCPMMLVKASQSPFFEKKEHALEVLDIINQTNKQLELHTVEGTHHVHLNNPELVQGIICDFLEKYATGDRSEGGLQPGMLLRS